jgi:hypothetical protein
VLFRLIVSSLLHVFQGNPVYISTDTSAVSDIDFIGQRLVKVKYVLPEDRVSERRSISSLSEMSHPSALLRSYVQYLEQNMCELCRHLNSELAHSMLYTNAALCANIDLLLATPGPHKSRADFHVW